MHVGPLPGRRKEIYVMREVYAILCVLSVSIHEQRASSASHPTWRQTKVLGVWLRLSLKVSVPQRFLPEWVAIYFSVAKVHSLKKNVFKVMN